MSRITDNNHNSYPDTVTLSGTCTYVYVGDGCTGTIKDCSYCHIGELNTGLDLDNGQYIKVGNNNTDVTVHSSDYVIVGCQNNTINVGLHPQAQGSRFANATGANSVNIRHNTVGVDVTGHYADITDSKYVSMDAHFNTISDSSSIILESSTGNEIEGANVVDMAATNNNYVYADNLKLQAKLPYMAYKKDKDVVKVELLYQGAEKQAANLGGVLDRSTNQIIYAEQKGGDYTIVNGEWENI